MKHLQELALQGAEKPIHQGRIIEMEGAVDGARGGGQLMALPPTEMDSTITRVSSCR